MILNCHNCQGDLAYISQHHTSSTHLKNWCTCKDKNSKHTQITLFLSTCTHLHARNTSEMRTWSGTMSHVGWVSNAGRPVTWQAVLEQLRNCITRCLNRPLRDALSFPAGKADQSQLSSPWSRGEIEMRVDWFGTEWKVRWVEKWQDSEVFFNSVCALLHRWVPKTSSQSKTTTGKK